ncbi:hypothetical protein CAL29_15705 [Bordetella genomosp. 10]|uniref:Tripartite tricarboxylate transporter substrate binding protein n=2 Tax=Bordetella genomosp. 10 TaxID=1416804 RepID=A0A261SDM4_9BORD|nr:hypothetical protein CAL29_15705 [Bordetella genomosp. 10]
MPLLTRVLAAASSRSIYWRLRMRMGKVKLAVLAMAGGMIPMMGMSSNLEAEGYPRRPITLVVGGAPGSSVDLLARHLSRYMSDDLRQKVVVENKPGATGALAALSVMRAAPDGYTVYLAGSSLILRELMYGQGEVNLLKDMAPIGMATGVPVVLIMGKHVPGATLDEVIRMAKRRKEALRCASGGSGSVGDFLCDAMQATAGVQLIHVPYKQNAQALADLMEGRVDFYVSSVVGLLPHIQADRVRVMAVVSEGKFDQLADVPNIGTFGFSSAAIPSWYAFLAPKGTPDEVISRLNRSLNTVLGMAEVRQNLSELGYAVLPASAASPEGLEDRIAKDTAAWSEILRYRGMSVVH